MAIGKQIRKYRSKLKWTLAVLADISGVDVGTISALEVRDSSRSEHFAALAKAFGLTLEQLGDLKKDWPVTDARRVVKWGEPAEIHPLYAMERVPALPDAWLSNASKLLAEIAPEHRAETLSFLEWQAHRPPPRNGQTLPMAG